MNITLYITPLVVKLLLTYRIATSSPIWKGCYAEGRTISLGLLLNIYS